MLPRQMRIPDMELFVTACSPFSETSRTTQATQLDNGPIHMGHPTPAGGVIVPVPYGSAEAVLYPYCMGQLVIYCTCTAQAGQGHLQMAALTIYIACLFW